MRNYPNTYTLYMYMSFILFSRPTHTVPVAVTLDLKALTMLPCITA